MPETYSTVRVLVADDDPFARESLVDLLTALNYMVVADVASGAEAVSETARLTPDAVLLDVRMPGGLSGLDAAHAIGLRTPGVAVVLFTGDATVSVSDDDALRSNAVALLFKPVLAATLNATIRLAVVRARELLLARHDALRAREQLEARKRIERAKGILMRRTGSSEEAAYRLMQRRSQNTSVPMVQIAEAVIGSEPGQRSA